MKRTYIFFGLVLCLLAYSSLAAGAPSITAYTPSEYPVVDYSMNQGFTATANETIVLWVWFVDGVNQSNNHDNLSVSWSALGHKEVIVNATNTNGTSTSIIWYPYVKQEMAGPADTISDMDEAGYDNLMLGLEGDSPDFELILWATTEPYQAVIGNMVFVIIFGLPMVMFSIRQSSLLIPSMFGVIMGFAIFVFFPSSFAATASAIIVLSILATIFTLYKERRS